MTKAQPTPERGTLTTLTIEARDLDTDERQRSTAEVTPPAGPGLQRAALREAVLQLFPEAKLRSFSDGAATFLDSQHLIVASYEELPSPGKRRSSSEGDDEVQDALFAA